MERFFSSEFRGQKKLLSQKRLSIKGLNFKCVDLLRLTIITLKKSNSESADSLSSIFYCAYVVCKYLTYTCLKR